MSWIKRNLYFLIGSAVAVVLMALAGWFLYSKWELNNEILGKLNQDYEDLRRLNSQNPHPGSGAVDNIRAAKEQQLQLRELIQSSRKFFQPIAPVPELAKLTDRDFSSALSRSIDQLQHDASGASVTLPLNYNFSFEAQKQGLSFAPGSLEPLAMQLGEVKAICAILFAAKVNSLDNLRRERVCSDDSVKGAQSDYLNEHTLTNELAILTPYEMSFRCFSSELAAVLAGFATSPHGMLVKTLNVETAPMVASLEQPGFSPGQAPVYNMPAPSGPSAESSAAAAAFARRYGAGPGGGGTPMGGMPGEGPGGGGAGLGGVPYRGLQPGAAPVYAAPASAPQNPLASGSAGRGGLPTVLDERQLKITLTLNLIKLLPPKKSE